MKFTDFTDVDAHADAHVHPLQSHAVTDELPPSSFPDEAIADEPPTMQILAAIGDAMGRVDVLVLEAQRPLDRAAVREHFEGQALNSHITLTRDGRPWVDGFVSMAGYPQIPVGSIIDCERRRHRHLADVLQWAGQPRVLMVLSPEAMLHHAPLHCLKFMRDLVRLRREQTLTVIVCRDGQRIAQSLARECCVRRDFLVEPNPAMSAATAARALEVIVRAAGKGEEQ